MEFDDLQKVWDSQNNETLFAINTKAMHNRIVAKRNNARKITDISELLLVGVNSAAAAFILWMDVSGVKHNIYMEILSGWMFLVAGGMMISRIARVRGENNFERTMLGDLQQAISTASYQVRLSQIMRWNIVPVGVLCVLGLWSGDKATWIIIALILFFALVQFASRWEHSIYQAKKRELEILQNKLLNG